MVFIFCFVLISLQLLPVTVWSCEILVPQTGVGQHLLLAEEQLRPRPREGKRELLVSRERELAVSRENVWVIKFEKTQDFCFSPNDQEKVALWRENANDELQVQIEHIKEDSEDSAVKKTWQAGEYKLPLSAELLLDEQSRMLKIGLDNPYQEIQLFMIPDSLKNTSKIVEWMQQKGCIEQANMLRELETKN